MNTPIHRPRGSINMATEASRWQRPFLFVHSTGLTRGRSRDKTTRTKIHRHVMVDIGKARRRPPRNPQFDAVVHFPYRTEQIKRTNQPQQPRFQDPAESENALVSAVRYQSVPPSTYYEALLSLVPSFRDQHPLFTLESQWGDDMFSAYGMMLLLRAGSSLANPSKSK
jgi:hypothetical protein